jgi:hypothetical protein
MGAVGGNAAGERHKHTGPGTEAKTGQALEKALSERR